MIPILLMGKAVDKLLPAMNSSSSTALRYQLEYVNYLLDMYATTTEV